jgi:exonuclease VII large subunit
VEGLGWRSYTAALRALDRGYAIVRRAGDGIVSSVDQVSPGDSVAVQVRDGTFGALVQGRETEGR